ncbi:MAG: Xaa-Pro peptidase family protein [Syntrophomonadaceae bacterium]
MYEANRTRRIEHLQERLAVLGLDCALLVYSRDILYYCGTAQPAVLLVTPGDHRLLVRRSLDFALGETWTARDRVTAGGLKTAQSLLAAMGVKGGTMGLETDIISADLFLRIQGLFPAFAPAALSSEILRQRMIKDPEEIELTRTACAIMQAGHDRIFEVMKAGMTELELAAQIEHAQRRAGHAGVCSMRMADFHMGPGILASGENLYTTTGLSDTITGVGLSPAVAAGASLRRLQPGDLIMADIPTCYRGYHCDESRTYVLGEPRPGVRALQDSLRGIVDAVLLELRPGVRCSHLFATACDCARRLGVGEYFLKLSDRRSNLIGHGVGLEVNELPVLEADSELEMQANMITTIEMHLTHPDHGVIKTEFMVLITPDGYERLSVKGCELFVVDK